MKLKSTSHVVIGGHQGGEYFRLGEMTIRGCSIIGDDELAELRARASAMPPSAQFEGQSLVNTKQLVTLLDMCRFALVTPQGNTKSQKAALAVAALDKFLVPK
jgi:hypothetical protein